MDVVDQCTFAYFKYTGPSTDRYAVSFPRLSGSAPAATPCQRGASHHLPTLGDKEISQFQQQTCVIHSALRFAGPLAMASRLLPITCWYKRGCSEYACKTFPISQGAKWISRCQVEWLQVSTGICFCNFDKFCQIALQRSCSNLHLHQQCLREPVSVHSCQGSVTKLSKFCQRGG